MAGLVLALASAVVYVRVHDRQSVETVPTETATMPEPAPTPPAPEPEQQAPPPEREAKKAPVKKSSASPTAVSRRKAAKGRVAETNGPVQVVQNTLPSTSPALPAAPPPTNGPGGYPAGGYPATSQSSPAPIPAANSPAQEAPPTPQPHVVELAAGTRLIIRLGEKLSTDHNYTDDVFRGTLDEPIIREGFIIADKGSKVLGRIVQADKAGRVRGVASLQLALTEINTTDGQRIAVSTNSIEKQGAKSTGNDAAKIAGGAALGAIIGALGGGGKGAAIGAGAGGAAGTGVVLATRGKAAVIPNEAQLTFQLTAPVTITEKLNH